MKHEKTAQALSDIDEGFVAEADEAVILREKLQRRLIVKFCGAAACFMLAAGIFTSVYFRNNTVLLDGTRMGSTAIALSDSAPRTALALHEGDGEANAGNAANETDSEGEIVSFSLEIKKETEIYAENCEINVALEKNRVQSLKAGEKTSINGKVTIAIETSVYPEMSEFTIKTDGGYKIRIYREAESDLWYAEKIKAD